MDKIILTGQPHDLGYGIKTNMVNILRYSSYWDNGIIIKKLSKYGIPIQNCKCKNDLVKFINTLTLDDIKGGYIILVRANTLTITDNMLKGEIKRNYISTNTVSHWESNIIIGRKKITVNDLELTIKSRKISKIKNKIKIKDDPLVKEINNVYNEFGIYPQGINEDIISNMNKLIVELIKERKKNKKILSSKNIEK